jgi:hypothetical protein
MPSERSEAQVLPEVQVGQLVEEAFTMEVLSIPAEGRWGEKHLPQADCPSDGCRGRKPEKLVEAPLGSTNEDLEGLLERPPLLRLDGCNGLTQESRDTGRLLLGPLFEADA